MEYKGYQGHIEIDEDAGVLHGEVVGLRDVVTFQGQTVAEAREAFKASVDDYLAFCQERGEEPERPFSGKFVVRVGSELHRQLSMQAKKAGLSLNALVTERLKQHSEDTIPK